MISRIVRSVALPAIRGLLLNECQTIGGPSICSRRASEIAAPRGNGEVAFRLRKTSIGGNDAKIDIC